MRVDREACPKTPTSLHAVGIVAVVVVVAAAVAVAIVAVVDWVEVTFAEEVVHPATKKWSHLSSSRPKEEKVINQMKTLNYYAMHFKTKDFSNHSGRKECWLRIHIIGTIWILLRLLHVSRWDAVVAVHVLIFFEMLVMSPS